MGLCRLYVVLGAVMLGVVEAAAQLPPAMQADLALVEAERHIRTGDQAAAQAALDRILALQAAHDLALPAAFWFQSAQVAYQAGRYADAEEAATRYLTTVGREGVHYRVALELLDRAAAERHRVEAEQQRQAEERQRAAEAAARRRQAAEAERRRLAQLPREIQNSLGMAFVLVAAGTFEMGSPATESGRDADEGPVHAVTLSRPFYLGKYEVTQGQWEAVMGTTPSRFPRCGRTCPVEMVSWDDAQAFIAALNRQEGVPVYRLPTEAEWEYAARAGTQTAYHFGHTARELERYAWYGDNGLFRAGTHPVGQKQPNGWGLYDMHGNVWEWVADWYGKHTYSSRPAMDPRGPRTGTQRVFRGGDWAISARHCRAASRGGAAPDNYGAGIGFRLARTP